MKPARDFGNWPSSTGQERRKSALRIRPPLRKIWFPFQKITGHEVRGGKTSFHALKPVAQNAVYQDRARSFLPYNSPRCKD